MNVTINSLRHRLVIAATAAVLVIVGGLGLAVRANAAATPMSPRPTVLPAVSEPVVPGTVTHTPRAAAVVTVVGCDSERLTVLTPEDCS